MTKPKRRHIRTRPPEPAARSERSDISTSSDTLQEQKPNGEAASSPGDPLAPAPANPLGELAPAMDAEPAPDAQAAFASLEPKAEPLASAELPPPATGGPEPVRHGPPKYTPPNKAGLPPGYVHRGDKWLRDKKKSELAARVQELQTIIETRPAAPAAELAVEPVSIEECRELLTRVVPAIDAVVVFALGDVFKATAKDQELLVSTTAPVVFPHYAELKTKLPWIPAGVALLAVYLPKALEKVKEERAKKKAEGAGVHNDDERVVTAANVESRVIDFPAPARQYGGPVE